MRSQCHQPGILKTQMSSFVAILVLPRNFEISVDHGLEMNLESVSPWIGFLSWWCPCWFSRVGLPEEVNINSEHIYAWKRVSLIFVFKRNLACNTKKCSTAMCCNTDEPSKHHAKYMKEDSHECMIPFIGNAWYHL